MGIDPQNIIGGGAGAFIFGIVHKILSYNSRDFPRWIGIDITPLAINLIRHRLHDSFVDEPAVYQVICDEGKRLNDQGK